MRTRPCLWTVLMVFLMNFSLVAQEKAQEQDKFGWKKDMVGSLNLTQASFSNWAAGGDNAFAWQINLSFGFLNTRKKTMWANSGKLAYGATKIGGQDFRKSIDELKLESVLVFKMGTYINPFVAVTGETQFGPGYNYATIPRSQISDFMDPAYFRESIGIGFEPDRIVRTRLGFALKQTITRNFPIPYADNPETVDKIEKFRNEAGLESVTDINWKLSKKTLFTSKMELFYGFNAIKSTDVRWDNVLVFKFSEHINVNFNFRLVYDRDISPRRQIQQSIALGLTWSFF